MSEFVFVAKPSDFPESATLCVEIEDRFLVLVRLGESYYCLDDICTHDGGPLGEGELTEGCLVCPRHGAKFDVTTGEAKCMPATEPTQTHEVRVEEDGIFVRLAD